MVTITGYGHNVYSVIVWRIQEQEKSRTVCYDEQEECEAINKKFIVGDFGKMYDECVIWDIHRNIKKIIRKEGKRYKEFNTIFCNG